MTFKKNQRGTPEDRFLGQLSEPDENGCIHWLGHVSDKGYGIFSIAGTLIYAHIFAWERENGTVPDGLELDHVYARGCRSTDCCNTAHLEPVTHAENMRRMAERRTHCVHGHPYADHQYIWRGVRRCRVCMNRYQSVRRARQRMERS